MTRALTHAQLDTLRGAAIAALESPRPRSPARSSARPPAASPRRRRAGRVLDVAPEDLVVACDMALGWDVPDAEDLDEREALVGTYHMVCADAWAHRIRRIDVVQRRGPRASRATRVIVSGPEFAVRVADLPCAGASRETIEFSHGDRSRRAFVMALTRLDGPDRRKLRPWWMDE